MKKCAISIVLGEQSALFADGFQIFIKKETSFILKGRSDNGEDLITLVEDTRPDIVMTEIDLPKRNGIGATQHICVNMPGTMVLALSSSLALYNIRDILKAGAIGYLHKTASKEEIIAGITAAYDNRAYFCNTTQHLLTRHFYGTGKKNILDKAALSEMEQHILQLVCDELSTEEIAGRLDMQKRTVDGYRQRIAEKAGARNLAGMVKYAIREGLYNI